MKTEYEQALDDLEDMLIHKSEQLKIKKHSQFNNGRIAGIGGVLKDIRFLRGETYTWKGIERKIYGDIR